MDLDYGRETVCRLTSDVFEQEDTLSRSGAVETT